MAKAEAKVWELVGMIERGELRLPEMQRRYVWRAPRVRDLLDSLYRGYPSGAILLWETDEAPPLLDFAVSQQANPYQSIKLLLDGQQRLTSLSAVIRGTPIAVRGRQRPIEILFNLEHPDGLPLFTDVEENADDNEDVDEEAPDASEDELLARFNQMAFVVATKKLEALPQWVKVSEVFKSTSDAPFLQRAGVTGFDDPRYEKYSERLKRLRAIRDYSYRLDILERTLSYEEVTEIFVRVNSLGAKLRSSDLALAQITARWRGALAVFEAFQRECAGLGFELDLGLLLKALMAIATDQSRFDLVRSLDAERLKAAWQEATEAMRFALNFARSNVGLDSPALFSSPFILVLLAHYGQRRRFALLPEEAATLKRWALLANAKGRYSRGSTETLLDQDLATVRDGGDAAQLIERLRAQVGRLDITPEELEGRNARSALFKTMFLAFRAAGATDWRSQLAIALDHSGQQHKLQFHHIFPKALLKAHGLADRADDIANLAFIGGKTNRQISDKAPAEYLLSLRAKLGDAPFTAQAIPIDRPELLKTEAFEDCLRERRQRIVASLNAYLGTTTTS
ncbi:hypothetical protein C3497_12570 [Zoogloeaceae bacteirum Par-f-2]|nr:hypothetical protein C3497_12570 [Zoogloeaceae bacteirum Par-f-2]